MLYVLRKIISNVLIALYQPFWFSVLLTIFVMFFYLVAREIGAKPFVKRWIEEFKKSKKFRILFLLVFYTSLLLFRTLLNRNMWANPLSDVIGPWGLHKSNGDFTTECVENLILFIPFIFLLLCTFKEKILKSKITFFNVAFKSSAIAFICSLGIELTQLFLRLGNFQLSDLFYNTLGGLVGGIIYYIAYKIKEKIDSNKR